MPGKTEGVRVLVAETARSDAAREQDGCARRFFGGGSVKRLVGPASGADAGVRSYAPALGEAWRLGGPMPGARLRDLRCFGSIRKEKTSCPSGNTCMRFLASP
jgi:hypothetical protein